MAFEKGRRIKVEGGKELEIIDKLGEGGQGEVYRVKYDGDTYALKWYFAGKMTNPQRFYDNILNNIKQGSPSSAFLWPKAITEWENGTYGYIMDLRPQEYKDFSRFLLAKERFSSTGAVINAALEIVGAFYALHNRGFSYQDLNDGNFFVDPQSGKVLICDNDNVAPYGENLGIAGKCRYMAPEVVTGESLPSIHTDRFSLAVVLFMLLFMNHPLEGKKTMCPCLTDAHERRFYGTDPLFIFDKTDASNPPVRGVHANAIRFWPVYPKFIREKFCEAFSRESMIGDDKRHRVTEKDWQETFLRLRDCLVPCPSCKDETYIDTSDSQYRCISCGLGMPTPPILKAKKTEVILLPGVPVTVRQISSSANEEELIVGKVVESKARPGAIGLKNTSNNNWIGILPNGDQRPFEPGKTVPIKRGLKINFGGKEAEIQ